jgi:hypothetical protein
VLCLYDLIRAVKLAETVIGHELFEYFNTDYAWILAARNTCQLSESALRIPHTLILDTFDHWWVDNLIVRFPHRVINGRELDGRVVVAVDCIERDPFLAVLLTNSLIFQSVA